MERKISYYSDGVKIGGILYEPDNVEDNSCPGVVLCQGMAGVKEWFWFPTIGRNFAELGWVTLIWDYRGVGESEGEPGHLSPLEQASDIHNALTYLEIHPKVDPDKLALIGWSFGGGMVPYVAGVDERVKASVSVVGWGDGYRWLRDLRRYYEWVDLLEQIDSDRKARVLGAKSEVFPPGHILAPSMDDAHIEVEKKLKTIPEMENLISTPWSLATAEMILEFKPMDVVDRISPRPIFYIVAERDTRCPADQVIEMYDRTKEPKKLWAIPGIGHHNVYLEPYQSQVMEAITTWLKEQLQLDP